MNNEPIYLTKPGTSFSTGNGTVLTITADGLLVPGEGLSHDEASRKFFECLTRCFKFDWDTRAELEKRVAELEGQLLQWKLALAEERFPGGSVVPDFSHYPAPPPKS